MIKWVFSDLDGTLIPREAKISDEDCRAIRQLQKEGMTFGIVTGRDIGFCRHLMEIHQLHADCVIANNGGSLWKQEVKLLEHHMEAQETIHIMETLKPFLGKCHPFICSEDREFFLMKHAYTPKDWIRLRKTLAYLGKLSETDLVEHLQTTNMPVVKISLFTIDQKTTDELLPKLQRAFPAYEVLPTAFDYIELTKKGIHKGQTLSYLMRLHGLAYDEVAVIGDGWNDVSMFSVVEHSFVMKSAPNGVQQQGRQIVKSVAEALQSVIQYNNIGNQKNQNRLEDDGHGK